MSRKWSSSTCVVRRRNSPARRFEQRVADDRVRRPGARGTGRAAGRRSRSPRPAPSRGGPRRPVEHGDLPEDIAMVAASSRIASSPISDGTAILTSPLTMMNRASPGSPTWKMTSPRRKRRERILAARSVSRAASSSPAKNGIPRERRDERSGRRACAPSYPRPRSVGTRHDAGRARRTRILRR